jgi:pimeloyl-ACP methyl ester carboxylesterase
MPELWERSQYFKLSHGGELYAHIVGHGEPLLMIPGFGCNHYPFEGIQRPLSEHFKLIMIHNRGMGLSSPATKHYELEDLAQDAIEVMGQLGYDKYNVLGISLGGLIAEEVALQAPEKVSKLCLLCTTGAGRDFVELKPFSESGLIDFYKMDPMERSVLLTEATVDQSLRETKPERFNQIVKLRYENRADLKQVIIQNGAAIKYLGKKKDLSKIQSPTLVLSGDQDRTVSPQNSVILGKIISKSRVAIINGTDHMFALEKPLLTATHIEDFLSSSQ